MNPHGPLPTGRRHASRGRGGVPASMLMWLAPALLVLWVTGAAAPDSTPTGAGETGDISLDYLAHPIPGTDSTGAVYQVIGTLEAQYPRTLKSLAETGAWLGEGAPLQPGDVLLYGPGESDPLVAGIYLGDTRFFLAHAPEEEARRMALDLSAAQEQLLGVRRLIGNGSGISSLRARYIAEGLKYLEVPYEFGSRRASTSTMDCSDFARRAYHDTTGEWLPTNSRTQGRHVSSRGETTTDWRALEPGDLMFFTQSGSDRIGHVSIYIGDERMLHTYSVRSGGVRIDPVRGQWDRRFAYGGSVLDDQK